MNSINKNLPGIKSTREDIWVKHIFLSKRGEVYGNQVFKNLSIPGDNKTVIFFMSILNAKNIPI